MPQYITRNNWCHIRTEIQVTVSFIHFKKTHITQMRIFCSLSTAMYIDLITLGRQDEQLK